MNFSSALDVSCPLDNVETFEKHSDMPSKQTLRDIVGGGFWKTTEAVSTGLDLLTMDSGLIIDWSNILWLII